MLSSDQTQAADSTATNSWFSDLKQKRDEYNTEIRKKKREDQLKKIRNSNIDIDKKVQVGAFSTLSGSFDTPENSELKRKINEWFKHSYKVDEFLDLILAINSEDRFQQHYGAIGLRKLLSQEEDPPIQYAVENNVIPRLLQFTQFVNEPHLQLEAAWILTNITSGNAEQTKAVVDHEALPYIISLMKSPQIEIVEQGIWTLGNIGGDSKKLKELVINSGGLEAIVHVVENTQNAGLIKHGIWALSNLCRGRKLPTFDIVNKALPIFAHSIKHTTDTAILIDAVWALSYLSDGDSNQINLVLESGVLESLMRLIKNPNPTILAPVIRTLGNIAAGDDEHITILLQMPNIIEYLFNLLSHQKKVIKKEVCWTLSNITAGNEHHIQAVLGNAACLEKILTVTMTENVDTIREALWILTNATHRCSLEQMVKIAQAGVLECFCTLLKGSDEAKILEVVLDGINNILRQGDKIANRTDSENPFMIELEQKQLIPRIEELQRHPSIEVYQAAINLLEKHFDLEDDI